MSRAACAVDTACVTTTTASKSTAASERTAASEASAPSDVAVRLVCPNAPARDLLVSLTDDSTVGHLAELLGLAERALVIDGRRFSPSALVREARLWDGATIGPDRGSPSDVGAVAGAVAVIAQLAGWGRRQQVALWPGRYVFGASLDDDASETVFELEVDGDGGCLFVPVTDGVTLDGVPVGEPVLLDGQVISVGVARFTVTSTDADPDGAIRRAPRSRSRHRTPRRLVPEPPNLITWPEVPAAPGTPPAFSWIMMLAPLPAAALMALLFNPRFAFFAAMGPIMVLARWVEGRRTLKKQTARYQQEFGERSAALESEIEHVRRSIAEHRRAAHPGPSTLAQRVIDLDPRLWERRPEHDDFAHLSVALADLPWQPGADSNEKVKGEYRAVTHPASFMPSVPVVADLTRGPLGIVGGRDEALAFARSLVMAAAVESGPHDLPMTLVAPADRVDDWDWMKWLPHLGSRVPMSADELDVLVAKSVRIAGPTVRDAPPQPLPVFVIDGVELIRRSGSPLRRALAEDTGISAIVIAEDSDDLPASCAAIIELGVDGTAVFSDLLDQVAVSAATPVSTSLEVAESAARALAWMEDPDGSALGADLPQRVLLPELIAGIGSHDTLRRWIAAGDDPRPVALIGVGPAGPLEIDMVRDGPHGLLAGTTGAGKSEFLRSYVASLAAANSPDHVNFVLIDYKGGGAFDVCAELPHTVAVVTDLDGHLGERALRSLKAELTHREVEFRSADVHDLSAYRETGATMARLVVVVDEFATLAAELPDFLGALVDIAQRGRSLGIHMVLATQRPAGVLDNKIRANTNLRISLRVQDENDSLDVIGIDAAAKLTRDDIGRGYLRLGASEVTGFQAAYVGGRTPDAAQRRCGVSPFQLVTPAADADPWSTPVLTDLDRMVAHIADATIAGGYAEPRRPWLPALPSTMSAEDLEPLVDEARSAISIGMVDLPDRQAQQPLVLDLDDGNVVVYGTDGAATANTVATIALALAHQFTPDELHLHLLDRGVGALAPLAQLPHCGASVAIEDLEMVGRLVDLLESDLAVRRSGGLAARGRRTVLIAEGLGALFETLNDLGKTDLVMRLSQILRDGPSLGLVVIGSASHDRGIPVRIANQIGVKLLHQLADDAAYTSFGLRPRDVPALSGFDVIDLRSDTVGVVASFCDGDLHRAVADVTVPARVERPPATIRLLGERVVRDDLDADPTRLGDRMLLPVGLTVESVTDGSMELEDRCLVIGPSGSGKTTTLLGIIDQVRVADPEIRVVALGRSGSPLATHAGVDAFMSSALGPDDEVPTVDELVPTSQPTFVVIDDGDRVDPAIGTVLEQLSKRAGQDVWFVAASRPDGAKDLASWLKVFRGARSGVCLQPAPTDGEVFRLALPLRAPQRFPVGRGYVISSGVATLTQLALRD